MMVHASMVKAAKAIQQPVARFGNAMVVEDTLHLHIPGDKSRRAPLLHATELAQGIQQCG